LQLSERLPPRVISDAFDSYDEPNKLVAIAVSGGSDSMALLQLASEAFHNTNISVVAMTVDHALRPESRREAEKVAAWCDSLGVEHHCTRLGISYLMTGHTLDDQAETFLMRLARGSGVDGLSAISEKKSSIYAEGSGQNGVALMRPLLGLSREQLRGHLRAIGQDWIDDPTNEDATYDRVKARQILETLGPLGLTKERLATTARVMGMAREALEAQAGNPQDVWDWSLLGFARTNVSAFNDLPKEIALRRLSAAMMRLTGNPYRPRLKALEGVLDSQFAGHTLHGCIVRNARAQLIVMREPNAVAEPPRPFEPVENWDNRFQIDVNGPRDESLTIRMIGEEGLRQIPVKTEHLSHDWHNAHHYARMTTPALWRDDVLVFAPLAPWAAQIGGPELVVKAHWSK